MGACQMLVISVTMKLKEENYKLQIEKEEGKYKIVDEQKGELRKDIRKTKPNKEISRDKCKRIKERARICYQALKNWVATLCRCLWICSRL